MAKKRPISGSVTVTSGTSVIAFGAAANAAIWHHLAQGVTVSLIVSLVLLPVWWANLRHYKGATPLVIVGVASALFGTTLGLLESGREVSFSLMQGQVLDFAACVGSIGVLLWSRRQIGIGWTAIGFGMGSLADTFLTGLDDANVWKFSLAIPVALLLLGVAIVLEGNWVEIAFLMLLASMSLMSDSRSMTAFFVLVVPVLLWQMAARTARTKARPLSLALWLGVLALGAYNLFQALLLDGALGEAARQRSEAQIDTSGSLILGGRPEVGASVALIGEQPAGYGAGVLPNSSDVWIAKGGMGSLGYDPNNGYVERYMFGTQFEVHSVLGDVWIRLGAPAAVFMCLLLALALAGALGELSRRRCPGVVIYLLLLGAWNIFFSPALPSYPVISLLAAVAVAERAVTLVRSRYAKHEYTTVKM